VFGVADRDVSRKFLTETFSAIFLDDTGKAAPLVASTWRRLELFFCCMSGSGHLQNLLIRLFLSWCMTHERYTYFGMARATFTGPTGAGPQRQSIRRFERVVMAGRGYVVKGKNCFVFYPGNQGRRYRVHFHCRYNFLSPWTEGWVTALWHNEIRKWLSHCSKKWLRQCMVEQNLKNDWWNKKRLMKSQNGWVIVAHDEISEITNEI
jgi:hypothetical protein